MSGILKKISNLLKTERKEPRFAAYGDFPGHFFDEKGMEFSVIPIDISTRGLGLLIDPSPNCKDLIKFELQRDNKVYSLEFRVVHVETRPSGPIKDLNNMRRCGLEISGNDEVDLIKILSGKDYLMIQE